MSALYKISLLIAFIISIQCCEDSIWEGIPINRISIGDIFKIEKEVFDITARGDYRNDYPIGAWSFEVDDTTSRRVVWKRVKHGSVVFNVDARLKLKIAGETTVYDHPKRLEKLVLARFAPKRPTTEMTLADLIAEVAAEPINICVMDSLCEVVKAGVMTHTYLDDSRMLIVDSRERSGETDVLSISCLFFTTEQTYLLMYRLQNQSVAERDLARLYYYNLLNSVFVGGEKLLRSAAELEKASFLNINLE